MSERKTTDYYHGIIKKVVGAFGALFSNIHITRRMGDSVTGDPAQTLKIPISFSQRTKWWTLLTSDPARAKQVYGTFPRMFYEIIGYTYDTSRKKNRGEAISCTDEDGGSYTLTPAPWNIDISLYVVGTSDEDVWQIVEQIIPLFNPDYSIKVKMLPELNVASDLPISLTSIALEDPYEGSPNDPRIIVYTLTFTAKTEFYGRVYEGGIIYDVQYNVDDMQENPLSHYHLVVDSSTGEIVIDEWTDFYSNNGYDPNTGEVVGEVVGDEDQDAEGETKP